LKIYLQIFRKSGVTLWNSGSPLVEEYIRSCIVLERADNWKSSKNFGLSYFNCLDYVHPGYVAVSEILQLFLSEFTALE
jgi:hypothetical protein